MNAKIIYLNIIPVVMRVTVAAVGAKLQATNPVPRPVDRGTATRYGG